MYAIYTANELPLKIVESKKSGADSFIKSKSATSLQCHFSVVNLVQIDVVNELVDGLNAVYVRLLSGVVLLDYSKNVTIFLPNTVASCSFLAMSLYLWVCNDKLLGLSKWHKNHIMIQPLILQD